MCINNPKTSIITDNAEEARYLAIIADLDARLDALAEDFKEIRAEQREIRAEQQEIRAEQQEIRAEQMTLSEEIALELKYSEEDLVFFKNLNAQMDAALAH